MTQHFDDQCQWWLVDGYDQGIGHTRRHMKHWEMASMVVTWWIVDFLHSDIIHVLCHLSSISSISAIPFSLFLLQSIHPSFSIGLEFRNDRCCNRQHAMQSFTHESRPRVQHISSMHCLAHIDVTNCWHSVPVLWNYPQNIFSRHSSQYSSHFIS